MIACLGLFGLAAFTVEQRTKEIGVRKVLGASVLAIATLLSRDLLKPTVVACAVSMLPAYFLMLRWLRTFADQVEIGPDVFLLAGATVLVVATFTVSVQSVRAACADPVRSLRYE